MIMLIKNINHRFDFKDSTINRLVIENSAEWRNILTKLQRQILFGEEFLMLFDDLKELNVPKNVEVIYSPIDFSPNQTRFLSKLYKDLAEDCVQGEKMLETMEIKGKIAEFVGNLIFDKEMSLMQSEDFDVIGLFKLTGVKFEDRDGDMLSKILDFMLAVQELEGDKIFIFVGLSDFISIDEKDVFYDTIISKKIKLLLLDRNVYGKHQSEKLIIIDHDLCEI